MKPIVTLIFYLFCCTQLSLAQFDIPAKPEGTKQTSVYDDAIGLLSASQKQALEQKLIRYADSTSTQIIVAIIGTTNGDDISLVATKWGHDWGFGQKEEDNGIVILIAKDDRDIDISTGYGIEYRLTDIDAERIINRVIIPEFKKGNFYKGLDKGTTAMFKILNGEFEGKSNTSGDSPKGMLIFLIIVFVIFIIALSSNRRGGKGGGKNGGNLDSRDLFEAIIFSNMGRGTYRSRSGGGFGGFGGGSSGGSFGGGGFSGGFGGGGFGGGGASGSW
ncbi:MAG: TPM domain-containing protein [Flavobacteriaceae bacterium]|nr:TPM domain-containing protein [Flavobacteriaceae bacterium]